MKHPFIVFRESAQLEGAEIQEDLPRVAAKEAFQAAWNWAKGLLTKYVTGYLLEVPHEGLFKEYCKKKDAGDKFAILWGEYKLPEPTGCGSSLDKVVESVMAHWWNTGLNDVLLEFPYMAKGPYLEDLVSEVTEAFYGSKGCSTCGSATSCSSKS